MQRPKQAKLLIVDARGRITHMPRSGLVNLFHSGDLVIANDAATLPASLGGVHLPSGRRIEVRLAGWDSLAADEIRHSTAIVFGEGDFRMRTEDRPEPPRLRAGDKLALGPLRVTVERDPWSSAAGAACIRRIAADRSGRASPATASRFSIRT